MMMPLCRERGGKKHTNMDALLSLFDVSLSLSLSCTTNRDDDKERKKERKKEDHLFLLLLLLLLVPSKALSDDFEACFDRWSLVVFSKRGVPFSFFFL